VELPLDSWWHPAAGVPGWACGVSGAASRQLVVLHRGGTWLGVWCKWSCLSTAGGTPPRGYLAGRVVMPASPVRFPSRGGSRAIDVAFPLLCLGAHQDRNAPTPASLALVSRVVQAREASRGHANAGGRDEHKCRIFRAFRPIITAKCAPCWLERGGTVIQKLRIVTLRFGTARQKMER
jgi:hypothetical protein